MLLQRDTPQQLFPSVREELGFGQSGAGSHSRDGGRRYLDGSRPVPIFDVQLAQISCYPPRAQQRGSELHSARSPGPHSLSRRLLVPWIKTTIVWGFFPNCHLKNAILSLQPNALLSCCHERGVQPCHPTLGSINWYSQVLRNEKYWSR